MYRFREPLLIAVLAIAMIPGVASAGTILVPHQGRLLQSDDTPVSDGFYSLTFSIWTDSVGGTMIWSEMQDVSVHNGLFSCELGKLQPVGGAILIHANDNLYLETAVGGQTLSPRLALGTVPAAVSSSAVRSNVPGAGELDIEVLPDTTKVSASRASAAGQIDSYIHLTDDGLTQYHRAIRSGVPRFGQARFSVSADTIKDYRDMDDDGDGVPEASLASVQSSAGSFVRAESELNGLSPRQRLGCLATPDSAAVSAVSDIDRDGESDQEASLRALPTTSAVAIKTKGTGADKNRTASVSGTTMVDASLATATLSTVVDVADDGHPGAGAELSAKETRSELKTYFETGDIPTQDQFSAVCDPNGVRVGLQVSSSGQWSSSSSRCAPGAADDTTIVSEGDLSSIANMRTRINELETKLQNLGLLSARTITQRCDADSATAEVGIEYTPVGSPSPYSLKVKEKGNRTKCGNNLRTVTSSLTAEAELSCDTAGTSSLMMSSVPSSTGVGTSLVLQTDASGTANPIQHSSGAHLTAGGTWTNASDANLKENFQPVDGEQLLEKIEQLPITEWNYKNESDDVKHIGPTAQDFKEVFGVGSNDRTISTIDPSGIALAAIKQLKKENNELKQQVEELRKLVEALSKKK